MIKIDQKIVGWEVVKEGMIESMQPIVEELTPYKRPYKLWGVTYKLNPPTMESALYVTINHWMMPDAKMRPFEVFLSSMDVTHSQWMKGITRLLSALFRQPLPYAFALEELKRVVDEKGSYFIPGGGGQCGGILAHIGIVLEQHCRDIGALPPLEQLPPERKEELAQKAEQANAEGVKAQTCTKCFQPTLRYLDGCLTCTNCGDSKCG